MARTSGGNISIGLTPWRFVPKARAYRRYQASLRRSACRVQA